MEANNRPVQRNQGARGDTQGRHDTLLHETHEVSGHQGSGSRSSSRGGRRGSSSSSSKHHHCYKRTFVYRGTKRHRHLQKRLNDDGMLPSTSHTHTHASHRRISVMSYNVLADAYAKKHSRELYSTVPWACLRWHTRASLLAKEIVHWSPMVVCLQEVDRYKHLESLLKHHGYVGRYIQRTNDRPDGLAMFWKSHVFNLIKAEDVIFAGHGLKDNVAQVYTLRYTGKMEHSDPVEVVVSNIHVLFNPKRGDIKLGQVRVLMDTITRASHDGLLPVVMCGDYNSAPYSGLYDFVSSGYLNVEDSDRRSVSGQVAGSLGSTKRQLSAPKPWKMEEIIMAVGAEDSILRHSLCLESSYKCVLGEEPGFTTAHDKYVGTVDYIFYSNGKKGVWKLEPHHVLRPPSQNAILPRGLPSGFWPSDHISLMTYFNLVHAQEDDAM